MSLASATAENDLSCQRDTAATTDFDVSLFFLYPNYRFHSPFCLTRSKSEQETMILKFVAVMVCEHVEEGVGGVYAILLTLVLCLKLVCHE